MSSKDIAIVAVTIEDREDGGLRVHSDSLPGLILSGKKDQVLKAIAPAIAALIELTGKKVVAVHQARNLGEVLKEPSPRTTNVHVHCEQFVVEFAQAA